MGGGGREIISYASISARTCVFRVGSLLTERVQEFHHHATHRIFHSKVLYVGGMLRKPHTRLKVVGLNPTRHTLVFTCEKVVRHVIIETCECVEAFQQLLIFFGAKPFYFWLVIPTRTKDVLLARVKGPKGGSPTIFLSSFPSKQRIFNGLTFSNPTTVLRAFKIFWAQLHLKMAYCTSPST